MRNYLISYCIFLIFFFLSSASSIENRIILKIDNSIITNVDVINEAKYLQALNPNLQDLAKDKILEIAKNSLIREKIKEIEISKASSSSINSEYLESVIKSIYMSIGFKNKKEFIKHIKKFDINMQIIEKKLSNETLWNQLIYNKFFSKIKIDKEKIKKDINSINKKSKSYSLNEIVYSTENNDETKKLFEKIKESIAKNGFENTAAIYSISETSKTGGNLGWVSENSINKNILSNISKIKIGEFTNPILIPGGFLILKVKDIKEIEKKINMEKEFNLRIASMQNQQLNQYSNIYYKKIKKDILIDEK
ncbi:peptidylprolyl isomerase [Candidatus Pelagibacter ubique]|uniref:peptidylprolyl isomerase n=1 Tax=Pelagibacter ubique TaxID=198252 RepID=UPI0003C7E4DE